jgi:acetylornithine deacetylase
MDETVELLARLVGFATVSRTPNAACIRFIADWLAAAGAEIRVLPGEAAGRENLLARFGPAGDGGVVLSGHSDVVPVAGQAWTSGAFLLREAAGKLFGRGAVDMKGFIACAMAAAARAGTLARPLWLAISHDEEVGCVGVRSMLARLAAEGFAARGCIVGEPTGMRVALGHKGKIAGCVCCRGAPAHSANPGLGCNAIYLATDMVAELRALQAFLVAHGARDAAYEVPYSTVHVGTIAGGTALNIVPEHCELGFEIRHLPGDDVPALLARLRAAAARVAGADARAAVEVRVDNEYPGVDTPADAWVAGLAASCGAGAAYKAGFGSEAGLFDAMLGVPSVVCGPGSIDRAHKADEYVARDELASCGAFLDRMVGTLR